MSNQEIKEALRIERKLGLQEVAAKKAGKKLTPELLDQLAKEQGVRRYIHGGKRS